MTQRKHITCWMFPSRVKDRSWVWSSTERPLCILYCILLPFVFYCQLDLQWENYTMLVFLFYHASVFDFPKYKKLYIALCHRKRMPDSLNCQKFPPETDRYDPKLVSVPVFRCFDTPVSGKSQNAAPPRQRSATANELEHWKMQEYVLIYQSGEKKNSFHLC